MNGKNVNFAGATFEDITIQNGDLVNTSSFYNNGTLTISSEITPVLSNGAGGQVVYQFYLNTSSTVIYDASKSSDREIMAIRHYNVVMENDIKLYTQVSPSMVI